MTLPGEKLLALYWLPEVGIGHGDDMQHVHVPLTDITRYRLENGQPQAGIVDLVAAQFTGTPGTFKAPYLDFPPKLKAELEVQPEQIESNVRKLQSRGIKVLLLVKGVKQMDWEKVPPSQRLEFAQWIKTDVVDRYGLDGIHIEEPHALRIDSAKGQEFVDTIAVLRHILADHLITLTHHRGDKSWFSLKSKAKHNTGKSLGELLDLVFFRAYGDAAHKLEGEVDEYHELGLALDKLCLGVEAGAPSTELTPTPRSEVQTLARWVVQKGLRGMALFTFSQDIQQWDHEPKNDPDHMFPHPEDHQWQKTIVEAMRRPQDWVVSSGAVIDVLCVVDGRSLLEKYPDTGPEDHKVLNSEQLKPYCRMITRCGDALSNNAMDDLTIGAKEGDTIRWRATSLTHDQEFRVDITDFTSFEDEASYIVKPHRPDPENMPDVWQTTIGRMSEDKGEETYYLQFEVVPNEGKGKHGYFDWDPKIVATRR